MAEVKRVIYRAVYCDKKGDSVTVDFKRSMSDTLPIPVINMITLAGVRDVPVSLSYKEVSEMKNNTINGSEVTFKIIGGDGFNLKSLYTQNETEWSVDIYGAQHWSGFVIPDSCSEPFVGGVYAVTVRATDRLGVLKDVPYQDGLNPYRGFDSDITTLQRALRFTGLNLRLNSGVNTFESNMAKGINDDPLKQLFADNAGFADTNRNSYSCYDVIDSVLKRWSAQLYQVNGAWQVVNALEKSSGIVRYRQFDTDGNLAFNSIMGNSAIAGGMFSDIRPTGSTMLAKALAQSTAYYNYGYPSNKLVNGDFQEPWPLPLTVPPGWFLDGNLKSARGVSQADPTDNYVILSAGSGGNVNPGWLRSTTMQIKAGEIVEFSFDLYAPTAFQGGFVRDKEVMFYAKDDKNKYFSVGGWVNGFADYHFRKNSADYRNQMTISVKIDPQDSDYRLEIGLRPVIDFAGDRVVYETNINNVNARPTLAAGYTTPAIGEYTVNKSLSEQTYKAEAINVIHSDDLSDQRTSSIRVNNVAPTTRLNWARSGYSESVSLLTTIANTELTMHNRPYTVLELEFNGKGDVDINTILSIDHPEYAGKYVFLSGDFDMMGGHHVLRYAEVLTGNFNSSNTLGFESIISDYGGLKDKSGSPVGTPNNSGGGSGGSIIDTNAFIRNQQDIQTGARFNVETSRANEYFGNTAQFSGNVSANQFSGNFNGGLFNDLSFMKFHWQNLGRQPLWLWGGDDPNDMYVFQSANLNVNSAIYWGGRQAELTDYNTSMSHILSRGSDGVVRLSDSDTLNTFLGLGVGGKYHQYNTFTANADTVAENTSNFSYALNAPYNGYLGYFGARGYGLQLSSSYFNNGDFAFRTKNGDTVKFNDWRTILFNDYNKLALLSAGLVVTGGSGTAYNSATVQVARNDSAPVLSFHWGAHVASTMTIEASGRIAIKDNPGTGYEDLIARSVTASNGWFRSVGQTGWVNESFGGGVYMIDSSWVRVYGGKGFLVESDIRGSSIESTTDGFKSFSDKGLVGNYNEAGTTSKIIWTIGRSWNALETMHGIGYEYEKQTGTGHTIFYAENGVTNVRISLTSGRIISKSGVESMNFVQGQVGGTGFRIDGNGNAEVDSLVIRKELKVATLNIREIIGTGGAFAVTNTFKVSAVTDNGSYYVLYFDNSNSTIGNQLRGGDIVRCQIWDGSGVKYYSGRVDSATGVYIILVKSLMSGSGTPTVGDVLFQFGSDSDSNRQGAIYMTNSDPGSPYIDVMDGITSDNWAGKTKVRLGKLNGLTGTFWGAMSGYGLYADNVYLSNGYFSGTVNVTGGNAETVTGSQTKVNTLRDSLGGLAYDNIVERAKIGTTVIQGGYIVADLLNVGYIQAQTVTAGYINTLSLDASAIRTGTLSADRIDVDNIVAKKLAANQGTIANWNIGTDSIYSGNINSNYMALNSGSSPEIIIRNPDMLSSDTNKINSYGIMMQSTGNNLPTEYGNIKAVAAFLLKSTGGESNTAVYIKSPNSDQVALLVSGKTSLLGSLTVNNIAVFSNGLTVTSAGYFSCSGNALFSGADIRFTNIPSLTSLGASPANSLNLCLQNINGNPNRFRLAWG